MRQTIYAREIGLKRFQNHSMPMPTTAKIHSRHLNLTHRLIAAHVSAAEAALISTSNTGHHNECKHPFTLDYFHLIAIGSYNSGRTNVNQPTHYDRHLSFNRFCPYVRSLRTIESELLTCISHDNRFFLPSLSLSHSFSHSPNYSLPLTFPPSLSSVHLALMGFARVVGFVSFGKNFINGHPMTQTIPILIQ